MPDTQMVDVTTLYFGNHFIFYMKRDDIVYASLYRYIIEVYTSGYNKYILLWLHDHTSIFL